MVGRLLAKEQVGVRFSLTALEVFSNIRAFKRHCVDNCVEMCIKDVLKGIKIVSQETFPVKIWLKHVKES
jgi:hypothetical protein